MDLNRATLIGRLTRDPELRSTTTGKTVATLSVVTNRAWNDQQGQKQEQAEFHNCVLWGKLADIAGQYLAKGRRVYIEGRIQTRDWTDQSGVKKYRTEIVGENLIMLDGPRGDGSAPQSSGHSTPMPDDDGSSDEIKVEDIPF
jgi:single-strand DNA-binding protein